MDELIEFLSPFVPLLLAGLCWHIWIKELRSGVIRLKLNSPEVVARRKANPNLFYFFSTVTFLLAVLWSLVALFAALVCWL
ncbi:MAG: hypothetical protein AB7O68_10415 [Pirellulales bacterium]